MGYLLPSHSCRRAIIVLKSTITGAIAEVDKEGSYFPPEIEHNKLIGGARGVMVIVVGNGHEFKSWTRLIAFHIALIPLGKV